MASQQLTTLSELRQEILPAQQHTQIGFFDMNSFEFTQRVAKAFASSTLVPQQYQNNVPNTMMALNMAQRMGADPLMVMQNLNIVHGRPAWSSKFLIATFNSGKRFEAMRFEFDGVENTDAWCCRALATERGSGIEVKGAWVSIQMAKDEGWYSRNGSKWKTMPQQMLMYRAATMFIGVYAPEISMGLRTDDELRDIIDVTPIETVPIPLDELAV